MRIAFYAPMKPPDHPAPSGDRRMARLLMAALALAGHEVHLASRLRSWRGQPDPASDAELIAAAATEAMGLTGRYEEEDLRPDLWFTYHLYYKAPDYLGPQIARSLGIPYLVAEASVAGKRAGGPWDRGHRAVLAALARATRVININPGDGECLPDPARARDLPPFLDARPYRTARSKRPASRSHLSAAHGLDLKRPWLIAVAMMRRGDKTRSYEILAAALAAQNSAFQFIIVGDGPAREEVESAFRACPGGSVLFLGERSEEELPALYAASDLCVWPAVREAYGMALLEAEASGLPVLAGKTPGVAAIIEDGVTGRLVPAGDAGAFAQALSELLAAPDRVREMGAAASAKVARAHDLPAAASRLDEILREALDG